MTSEPDFVARTVQAGGADGGAPTTDERFWERHESRVERFGQRAYELELRTIEYFGEGGVKMSGAEKRKVYIQKASDPTGGSMFDILMRRKEANGLGDIKVPRDFVFFDLMMQREIEQRGAE